MASQPAAEQRQDREVTLVIPATGGTTDVQRFINQVTDKFPARVMKTNGSAKETIVTLQLEKPASPSSILGQLTDMPEVDVAQEKRLPGMAPSSPKGIQVTLGANPDRPSLLADSGNQG